MYYCCQHAPSAHLVLDRGDGVGGVSPVHSSGQRGHLIQLEASGQLLDVLGIVSLLDSLGATEASLLLLRGGGGEFIDGLGREEKIEEKGGSSEVNAVREVNTR